jgi:DNA-binding NarL/FixJ family response regulator
MTDEKHIRVMLVDDHIKIHRAISALIDFIDDVELVAQGSNGREAIQLCEEHMPDVILMDVVMPAMDGIEATRQIHQQFPEVRILALSSFQDEDSVKAMMEAGAVGYLVKTSSMDDLANTLRTVHSGKMVFSPELSQIFLQSSQEPEAGSKKEYEITPRELEVLKLMIDGMNNGEIAAALVVSNSTVKYHVNSILTKLNANNRSEAITLAVEKHLVS